MTRCELFVPKFDLPEFKERQHMRALVDELHSGLAESLAGGGENTQRAQGARETAPRSDEMPDPGSSLAMPFAGASVA